MVLTAQGQIVLLTLEKRRGRDEQLGVMKANLKGDSKVVDVCAYKDVSGLFTTELADLAKDQANNASSSSAAAGKKGSKGKGKKKKKKSAPAPAPTLEDEDILLYGDVPSGVFEGGGGGDDDEQDEDASSVAPGAGAASDWRRHLRVIPPTYWLLMLRENGSLEVYSLPNFTLRYVIRNFHHGEKREGERRPFFSKDEITARL